MNRITTTLTIAIAGLVGFFAPVSDTGATIITEAAVADTFVANSVLGGNATFNYGALLGFGSDDGMRVANQKTGLIKFDISSIPADQVIQSAALRLGAQQINNGSGSIDVYMQTQDWGEGNKSGAAAGPGEATWNNPDGTTGTPWGGFAGGFGPGITEGTDILDSQTIAAIVPTMTSWDVTAAVDAWYQGTSPNHGLIVHRRNFAPVDIVFRTRNISAGPGGFAFFTPQLEITFVPIPEPASLGLLALGVGLMTALRVRPARRGG